MSKGIDRRGFLRGSIIAGAGLAASGFVGREERILSNALSQGADRTGDGLNFGPEKMPTGKLGDLEISRLISGGNLIGGWAHARDLLYVSELMKAYNTEERQFDTMALLEEGGVNTIQIDLTQLENVNRYREARGGKLQRIVSIRPLQGSWTRPEWREMTKTVDDVIEQGVEAIYIHGGYADQLVKTSLDQGNWGNVNYIGKLLDYIREQGYPAGLGCHALGVVQACDEQGVTADYYFKTFHNDAYWSATPKENRIPFSVDAQKSIDHDEFHDNIFDLDPGATAAYMADKEQPWFAFKTLAAGAIRPEAGLSYAFENGADFVVLGMFDFQIADDVRIAKEVLNGMGSRNRPWRS